MKNHNKRKLLERVLIYMRCSGSEFMKKQDTSGEVETAVDRNIGRSSQEEGGCEH